MRAWSLNYISNSFSANTDILIQHSIISQSSGSLYADRWLTGLIPVSGVCWSGTFSMRVAKSCKPKQLIEINALDLSQLSMTTLWQTFTFGPEVSRSTNTNLSYFRLTDGWKCWSVIDMQCHHHPLYTPIQYQPQWIFTRNKPWTKFI